MWQACSSLALFLQVTVSFSTEAGVPHRGGSILSPKTNPARCPETSACNGRPRKESKRQSRLQAIDICLLCKLLGSGSLNEWVDRAARRRDWLLSVCCLSSSLDTLLPRAGALLCDGEEGSTAQPQSALFAGRSCRAQFPAGPVSA